MDQVYPATTEVRVAGNGLEIALPGNGGAVVIVKKT
jgi:hypothetical protein